jgi:hypothetical protein
LPSGDAGKPAFMILVGFLVVVLVDASRESGEA